MLLADSASAATYWQPTLKGEGPWGSYADVGTNETILVAGTSSRTRAVQVDALTSQTPFSGPHLVRKATYVDRTTIALRGDLSESVMLWVFARREVVNVFWNGRKVDIFRNQYVGLEGPLDVHLPTLAVPALDWKYRDALPEIKTDFDDSSWTPADKTTSPNPFWPTTSTDTVLFAGEYGFHGGNVLWRGRFDVNDSSSPFALDLVVATGWGGAVSVYLNDHFVGSNQSLGSDSDELHLNLNLPESSIKDGENIAIVLQGTAKLVAVSSISLTLSFLVLDRSSRLPKRRQLRRWQRRLQEASGDHVSAAVARSTLQVLWVARNGLQRLGRG